jgi:hypothetical protein
VPIFNSKKAAEEHSYARAVLTPLAGLPTNLSADLNELPGRVNLITLLPISPGPVQSAATTSVSLSPNLKVRSPNARTFTAEQPADDRALALVEEFMSLHSNTIPGLVAELLNPQR